MYGYLINGLGTTAGKQAQAAIDVGIFSLFLDDANAGFVHGDVIQQLLIAPIENNAYAGETVQGIGVAGYGVGQELQKGQAGNLVQGAVAGLNIVIAQHLPYGRMFGLLVGV